MSRATELPRTVTWARHSPCKGKLSPKVDGAPTVSWQGCKVRCTVVVPAKTRVRSKTAHDVQQRATQSHSGAPSPPTTTEVTHYNVELVGATDVANNRVSGLPAGEPQACMHSNPTGDHQRHARAHNPPPPPPPDPRPSTHTVYRTRERPHGTARHETNICPWHASAYPNCARAIGHPEESYPMAVQDPAGPPLAVDTK